MARLGSAFDKVKRLAGKHSDKVERGLDKGARYAKRRTGGKYDEQIDTASDRAGDYIKDQKTDRDRGR